MNAKTKASGAGAMQKLLDLIERVGNKVPHPVVIFLALTGLVMVMSHVLYMFGVSVTYDALNLQTHKLEPTTVAVTEPAHGRRHPVHPDLDDQELHELRPGGDHPRGDDRGGAGGRGRLDEGPDPQDGHGRAEPGHHLHPRLRGGDVEHRHRRRLPGPDPSWRRRLSRPRAAPARGPGRGLRGSRRRVHREHPDRAPRRDPDRDYQRRDPPPGSHEVARHHGELLLLGGVDLRARHRGHARVGEGRGAASRAVPRGDWTQGQARAPA